MNKLLSFLLRRLGYFFPLVADPDPDPPEVDEVDDTVDDSGEDDLPEDPTPEDDEIHADLAVTAKPRRDDDLRARVDAAERRADEAAREVAALKSPRTSDEDRIRADEDARLRAADTSDMEKWQIQANRALRESQAQSRAALARAEDLSDLTAYQAKAIKNPTYAKFADKVEAKLKTARSQGQNVPRELILQLLVGEAVLNGKRAAPKPAAPSRGKPNAARSDVPTRGNMSDRQKRAARLANTQI